MMRSLRCLIRNREGATAVEYGIMVAAISATIIGTVFVVGTNVNTAFQAVVDAMTPAL